MKPEVRVSHRFSVSPGHGVVSDSSSVRMAPHQNNRATFSRAVLLFMAAAQMQAVRVIIRSAQTQQQVSCRPDVHAVSPDTWAVKKAAGSHALLRSTQERYEFNKTLTSFTLLF